MALGPRHVILFLAGDPVLAEQRASLPEGIAGFGRVLVPNVLFTVSKRGRGTPAEEAAHRFPLDQVESATEVVEAAQRFGVDVAIVDVNDRATDHSVVDQHVSEQDVLPVLVRADGQRLVGAEAFSPGSVRKFLRSA